MKRVKEEFNKKSEELISEGNGKDKLSKKVVTVTRTLVQEEDFILSEEEIRRIEDNCSANIRKANDEISLAQKKLDECKKLREMLN